MKLTLHFLCCILLKGLVAGNQQGCARYVEVRTTGSGYEEAGIPSDGSPVIFKLDVDVTSLNVYRNELVSGCLFFQYDGIYIEPNCPEVPDYNGYDYVNYIYYDTAPCFAYATNITMQESMKGGDGSYDMVIFTTPEAPCSDCRVITAGGAGSLGGSYTLQDHYNFGCGTDTDGCAYEKDGETYCFQENGLYDVDFNCPSP